MSEYYNATGIPQNSGPGTAIDIRTELQAIARGFDKLLALSTAAGQLVGVNAAGNQMEKKGLYDVGIWTPELTFETPGNLAIGYSTQRGDYIRLGNLVIAFFNLTTSTFTHTTASGQALITGLPYPANANFYGGIVHLENVTFAGLHITPYVLSNSQIQLIGATSATTGTAIGVAHLLSGTQKVLNGALAYLVNN